jgi:hypothetical protein
MKKKEDIEALERLIGQLQGLHAEISQLAKKSSNDAVNTFKLKLINKVISTGNEVLGESYRPFKDFEQFDSDDVPTNSDVTVILSQYIEQAERFRSDNVQHHDYDWKYILNGKPSDIEAAKPTKIGGEK